MEFIFITGSHSIHSKYVIDSLGEYMQSAKNLSEPDKLHEHRTQRTIVHPGSLGENFGLMESSI